MMDDLRVIRLIQAVGDGKIANKLIMNTQSHSDFSPDM
jgi:hypothetical protein